ncbi:MAG: hypothetical protein JNM27_18625 [Leptospirales bacterium]|nr:hypothetical protein [Leptospirales bacterium]
MRTVVFNLSMTLSWLIACQSPMERARDFGFDPCPSLGVLNTFPPNAVYSTDDGREILVIRSKSGSIFEIEKSQIMDATQISTRDRFVEFMNLYEKACGDSEPPFLNEIAFVRAEKRLKDEGQQRKRAEAAAAHLEEGKKLLTQLISIRQEKSQAIRLRAAKRERLRQSAPELVRLKPESFMIVGAVNGKDAGGVFFFGNAVPSGSSMVSPGAMFLYKSNGYLKAPKIDDIVLGQQLVARDVFFLGEGRATRLSGALEKVNIYSYEPDHKSSAQFNSLKRETEQLKNDLRELDAQLRDHDALENRLRSDYTEIRVPESSFQHKQPAMVDFVEWLERSTEGLKA